MSMIKMLLGRKYNIHRPEHLSDGAYIGVTDEGMLHPGVALFTTDGVEVTRPVYLDQRGIKAMIEYLKAQGFIKE